MDLGFVKHRTFWVYQIPSVVQSIVTPLPALWLPAFASYLGMSSAVGPLSLALLNLASCAGFMLQGRLVDRYHVSWAILVSTIGSAIAVFGFWGFGTHAATLYVFAILFGFFGAPYPGHWTGCACDMRRTSPEISTSVVISLLCAGKGIGTLVAGPVSEALLSSQPWEGHGLAYSSAYGTIIVFTGVCLIVGGAGAVPRLVSSLVMAIRNAPRPRIQFPRTIRTRERT